MSIDKIRNFCIIAHIDHGKSTLADRMLEETSTLTSKEMKNQVLDNMELERERGITIKSHAIQMKFPALDKNVYTLNLIDTPGHVDFSYEVSRSLAACEGALLIVDAAQGIEAQTMSNLYLAIDNDLVVIPVINKIDLPSARIDQIKKEIIDLIGCDEEEILLASAKQGTGVKNILEAIVTEIPAPEERIDVPVRAMIFDSVFDSYRGAIAYIRVIDGEIREGMKVKFFSNGKVFQAEEVGILRLEKIRTKILKQGEVGYLITGAKNVKDTKVGDTITDADNPAPEPLSGYKEVKPMVFSGMYPSDSEDFEELRTALDKLKLNDDSLSYDPETSEALGFGFRCGFLGLLHMEIIQERLEREYNLNLVTTMPSVVYKVIKKDGEEIYIDNPTHMPPQNSIDHIEEPYITAQIITPSDYIGNIMKLARDRRAISGETEYLDANKVIMNYKFPLMEIVFDFYDKLKSISRGYASFDYDFHGFIAGDLVKLDILINGDPVDALSAIVHKEKAFDWGQKLNSRLKKSIPRQMYEVIVQAAIGSKIVSRVTIKALRKNVTAKCYGGDISRKRKLLEKQKEGKKRMKKIGRVDVPQEAFLAVLKISD